MERQDVFFFVAEESATIGCTVRAGGGSVAIGEKNNAILSYLSMFEVVYLAMPFRLRLENKSKEASEAISSGKFISRQPVGVSNCNASRERF